MKNIIDKIWSSHVAERKLGYPDVFAIDFMLMHEVTSAQAFAQLEARGLPLFDSRRLLATLDHSIPSSKDGEGKLSLHAVQQIKLLRNYCQRYGIRMVDVGSGKQGIVHVIGPELGLSQPGLSIACGDSHTATHGAMGALAFGIGSSEICHILATGCLLLSKPKTMRIKCQGALKKGAFAKDFMLHLIQKLGVSYAQGYIIEFCGSFIESCSMEERMTICNMSIELGARSSIIAPDEKTIEYLKGREYVPKDDAAFAAACEAWLSLKSDECSTFDHEVDLDVSEVRPMMTWGTNPAQSIAIGSSLPQINEIPEAAAQQALEAFQYMGLSDNEMNAGLPIEWAFVGSCTNGRIDDLRIVANVLKGHKVHPSVTFLVVPGSEAVKAQAQQEGLDVIIKESGAQWRNPGCSMCLGMNGDTVPAKARCISSSNRNFRGRQGPGSRTHLASPATVAASAIAGKIVAAT